MVSMLRPIFAVSIALLLTGCFGLSTKPEVGFVGSKLPEIPQRLREPLPPLPPLPDGSPASALTAAANDGLQDNRWVALQESFVLWYGCVKEKLATGKTGENCK